MSKTSLFGIKAGLSAVLLAGVVQATPVVLSPISTNTGNVSWQDIKSTSYNLSDLNGNNLIDVGETVTFSVVMHKQWWGTHDYDAMKIWLDGPSSISTTQKFTWDYDPADLHYAPGQWTPYSNKTWTGGDMAFTFDYTFTTVGNYYLTASVMCSADLSTLHSSGSFDNPTDADWNAWTRNVHAGSGSYLQGEDERYKLTVNAPPPVPEPGTLGLMGLGLVGLAVLARKRRKA
jgi:PEP-CTERM motif